jgi:predicted DNA binding CopG/RHH family protein
MTAKRVNIGPRPGSQEHSANIDEWVANRAVEQPPVKMKRLTLDIPEPLHRAIKKKAADKGVTMADLIRQLFEKHYGSERS